jgi:uncharacterized membrane protein YcaP (DUF421 family)
MFRPGAPIAETILRGTVMYLAIYALMRLGGKRESGAHSLTDLLVVVLVAEAAAHGLAGENSSGVVDSVLLAATILAWSVAIDAITYRYPRLRGVIKSNPSTLVVDGRIIQPALRREFMSRAELWSELRLHGITDISEVARANLEPNGMISVIRADGAEPEESVKPPLAG